MKPAAIVLGFAAALGAVNPAWSQGRDVVIGSASGISTSDAERAGEGRDTVLSTVYGMRPSDAQIAGEGRDTYLSTESIAPHRPAPKPSAQPSAQDLAALAYLAHITGRKIPGSQ